MYLKKLENAEDIDARELLISRLEQLMYSLESRGKLDRDTSFFCDPN